MFRNFTLALALLCSFIAQRAAAQCNTGGEPECTCSTAPVLCTVDELDGYSFSMSSFQHPQDGPEPLCPGTASVPNNPTWFAFTAWCTDLTLEVQLSNCVAVGGTIGVQIAVYTDCTFSTPVACNVEAADCNTNNKTLVMSGLNIGDVYYFLIDGCLGSYCDVTIDILGVCGNEEIAPWTMPLMGNTTPCAGDTESYSVEDLEGAATYYWYVDGVLIGQTDGPNNDINWPTEGTFELCVDAANDPCVPVTDPPAPLCTTITVYDSDAGNLSINPNPLCPGSTANISVTGYNNGPNNAQAILITDASGQIIEVITGDMGTFTHPTCETFTVWSYNYIPAIGTPPMVGMSVNNFDCAAECCDLESQVLSFEDDQAPQFTNPPADLMLDCFDQVPPLADLTWTDNCDGTGTVPGMETGSADLCNGGTINRMWSFTDTCGNSVDHTQTITVDPVPAPAFVNPPADVTVTCDAIPTSAPDLEYTNNASGGCLIEGTVSPTSSGSADICGGSITYTWTFTDACGNTITHDQTVTVEPASPPVFLNPPADVTVTCANIPSGAPDLEYTNNESGSCLVEGFVSPTSSGSADICGGSITYTWTFTDPCGNTITHNQTVTVEPAPVPAFLNPPADVTVTCDAIPTSAPDLEYTNNAAGNCLIEGTVAPQQSGSADLCGGTISFAWQFVDPCGNSISHVQTITVEPVPSPTFLNPPADLTVDCANIPGPAPDLSYTNNESGACLISGTVSPVQSGTADACGGQITNTWEVTDPCGNVVSHVQTITVNPAPPATFLNPPADLTVSCDAIPASAPDLSYTNNASGACLISGTVSPSQSGSADECGGQITYTWQAVDPCGNAITHVQTITVDPAPPAAFTGPFPQDITVACNAVPTNPPLLSYTNNQSGVCQIQGNILPTQVGNYDECGGTFSYLWQFTDDCGRSITYQQDITVLPAPPAAFTNPPGPVTVNCADVAGLPTTLSYTNGQSGPCGINGSVPATVSGSYDECGGNLTYSWNFTDNCGRSISHTQNIQVNPASPPAFVNPPQDVTIDCGIPLPSPMNLTYTNNETGPCANTGSVPPAVVTNGLVTTYTWSFTNPCNTQTLTHTQTITQLPAPDIVIDPLLVTLCAGESFDLSSISVVDQNATNPVITYHLGSPANAGNQIPQPLVTPSFTTTYYILATSGSGCTDEEAITVVVEDPPFAGLDGSGDICFSTAFSVNLFQFLNGSPPQNGNWQDPNGYGVNLTNPFAVDLSGLPPGTYAFDYVVLSGGVCPDDVATVTLELLPEIVIDIVDVACSQDTNFYEVLINTNGFTVINQSGTLNVLGGGQVSITNIPISQTLVLTVTNPGNPLCFTTLSVTPPNCGCPNVPPPANDGNRTICEGEPNPTLSVSPAPGLIVNWYDAPSGGALLLADSETFTPAETMPGQYIFYAQTEDPATGCVSSVLTPVQLTILATPSGNDALLTGCDDDGDGLVLFNLSQAQAQIGTDPANTLSFHESENDALNDLNPLPLSYTNTTTPSELLFVRIENPAGCVGTVQLTLNVFPQPELSVAVQDEICLADSNGTVSLSGPSGALFSLDSLNWSTDSSFTGLTGGSYTAWVESADGCFNSVDFTIAPGLELSLDTFQLLCNDNGTPSDAADDFYDFYFTLLNNQGNAGTFTLSGNAGSLGAFTYGQADTLTFPADGQLDTLLFVDDSTACALGLPVGPLTPCSNTCIISFDSLGLSCNDNGTLTDPADDFYEITIVAGVVNPGVADSFRVFVAGVLQGTYAYGDTAVFTLPADGSSPVLSLEDVDEPLCNAQQTVGPLAPCDEDCTLTATVSNILCNDNGTGNDPNDDTFTFDLLVTGQNTGGSWQSQDGSLSGGFGSVQTFGPFPLSGGDLSFVLQDAVTPDCVDSIAVAAPAECSDPCIISFDSLGLSCNDNGTLTDPADDFYEIAIVAGVVNPGMADSFQVFVDGVLQGTYAYGETAVFTLPADGSSPVLSLEDVDEPLCSAQQTVGPLVPCDEDCTLTATVSNILCDDNGTGNDPNDDTFTFDLLVTGQNTGGSWQSQDGSLSGGFGSVQTFGPFAVSGGDLSFVLQDAVTPDCVDSIAVAAPAECSDPCIISFDSLGLSCNDNGTLTDPADDFYETAIVAGVVNPGVADSFQVFVDGVLQGTYAYGETAVFTLPADGSSPVLSLEDVNEPLCNAQQTVGPLVPCDEDCTLTATVSNILCDDNGTGNDPNDDTLTFDLLVTGQNTGGSWQSLDGSLSGGFGSVQTFGPFPLSGGDLSFGLQDAVTPTCLDDITVAAPAACSSCPETADAGPGGLLTCTDTTLQLTASASAPGAYSWSGPGGALGNSLSITVDQPGWYFFTADFSNNCSVTDSVFVDLDNAPPVADAGAADTLSCQQGQLVLDGSGSSQGPEFTYLWTTGNGNINSGETTLAPVISAPGLYELLVTDQSNGCQSSSTVSIAADLNAPLVTIASPDLLTCAQTSISLLGSVQGPGSNYAYEWTSSIGGGILSGGQTAEATVDAAGLYTLTVLDQDNGCLGSADVLVQQDTISPIAEAGAEDTLNCSVTLLVLDGSGSSQGLEFTYQWTALSGGNIVAGAQSLQPTVSEPGLYQLEVTDETNGCISSDVVSIVEDTLFPLVVIAQPEKLSCRDTVVQLDATGSSMGPGLNYLWSTNDGNIVSGQGSPSPSVNQPGAYVLTISFEDSGCSRSASVDVIEDTQAAEVDAGPGFLFPCNEAQAQLQGEVGGGLVNLQINWSTDNGLLLSGVNNLTPFIGSAGSYVLSVLNADNGCVAEDSVIIRAEAPEALQAVPEDPRCYGERGVITISDVEGGTPPYLYSIDAGETYSAFPRFNNLLPGLYELMVLDANGCESPVIQVALEEPAELQILLELQAEILLGDSYQIQAQVSPFQAALEAISWTPSQTLSCGDCLDPVAMPLSTTTYSLTVRDSSGCEASEDIRVYVDRRPVVYVPNAFSPNGDGFNDIFLIFARDESVQEVKSFLVFDRWGEKVFEYFNFQPNNPAYGWDGQFRGKLMDPAVFVWYAEIELITGQVVLFEGDVTLVR